MRLSVFFISLLICFTSNVYADSIEEQIKKDCAGIKREGIFYTGFSCSGQEKTIFYVESKKVTKEIFDIERKKYNEKGPLCDETQKDELPTGLSFICVKDAYGEYFYKGNRIGYSEFLDNLTWETVASSQLESNKKEYEMMKLKQTQLLTLESYVEALRNKEFAGSNHPMVGDSCIGGGNFVVMGNWYKNMRCEDKKVISLEYILDDKVVDKDTYITIMYKREKDYVDKYMLEKNMVSTKTSNSQELSITSKKDVPLIREIVEQKNASIPALDVQKSNNKNTFASMTLVKTWPWLVGYAIMMLLVSAFFILYFVLRRPSKNL